MGVPAADDSPCYRQQMEGDPPSSCKVCLQKSGHFSCHCGATRCGLPNACTMWRYAMWPVQRVYYVAPRDAACPTRVLCGATRCGLSNACTMWRHAMWPAQRGYYVAPRDVACPTRVLCGATRCGLSNACTMWRHAMWPAQRVYYVAPRIGICTCICINACNYFHLIYNLHVRNACTRICIYMLVHAFRTCVCVCVCVYVCVCVCVCVCVLAHSHTLNDVY